MIVIIIKISVKYCVCPITVYVCQQYASSDANPFWTFEGNRGIEIGVRPHIRRSYDVSSVSYANKCDCISRRRACRGWVSEVSVSNGIASRALAGHFCDCRENHNCCIVEAAQYRNRYANDCTTILDIYIVYDILGMRVTREKSLETPFQNWIECSKNLQKIDRKQCQVRNAQKNDESNANYSKLRGKI